jgi:large subunit ribosomal protein L15
MYSPDSIRYYANRGIIVTRGRNNMARRIKSKSRKYYGNRTFGGGNTKNRRGKGSKGGKGRGGFHKHKRMHYIVTEGTSTTESGFVNESRRKTQEINIRKVEKMIMVGKAKPQGDSYDLDLRKKGKYTKLLGNGELNYKANITVDAYTASAKEKVEKAGGKIITKAAKE